MKKYIAAALSAALMTGCGAQATSRTGGAQTDVNDIMMQQMAAEDGASVTELQTEAVTEVLTEAVQPETSAPAEKTGGDLTDLTEMGSDMVYAAVFEMMTEPDNYRGKTIKMHGTCSRFTDPETGQDYYACIITDAQACCAQGIEFKLPEGTPYPEYGSEITVTGTFGSYFEGENEFYVLENAILN